MSDDLTIAYQLGVEDMRSRMHKQADEIERLQQLNEYLRSEKERLSKDVYNLILKKEEVKTENEKLHREAAIRIDQIEREQEAHLKTMADLYYQAEMNARLLTENASFRGEIEKLRRDVKTAVMGDSAELQDVKRDNETLRGLLREAHVKMVENDLWVNLRQRVVAAIRESGDERPNGKI